MTVLVTGAAGYIGSHMVLALLDRGERVIAVDNLSTGRRGLVAEGAQFIEASAGDADMMRRLMREHGVSAVIHFAGSIVVPESVAEPLAYYGNNSVVSRTLIECCVKEGVRNFIFSSTAAVYGVVEHSPISEDAELRPINPYGRSKLITEWMLQDAAAAHDFRYVALRYFNVAGADPKGRSGQSSPKATHLIKRACQAALGRVAQLDIFGTDFPTPDGTGVRDYIHVTDLVAAHALALDHLQAGGNSLTANCGYGRGFSVREVIAAVEAVAKKTLPVREGARRPGDPPSLVADSKRLRKDLSWQPQYDDLMRIVADAYAWERRLNAG